MDANVGPFFNYAKNPLGSGATARTGYGAVNGSTVEFVEGANPGVRVITPPSGTRDIGVSLGGALTLFSAGLHRISVEVEGVQTESWRLSAQGSWVDRVTASAPIRVESGEVKRISMSIQVNAEGTIQMYLLRSNTDVSGELIIRKVQWPDVGIYLDGDTPGCQWLGVPGASISGGYPPR